MNVSDNLINFRCYDFLVPAISSTVSFAVTCVFQAQSHFSRWSSVDCSGDSSHVNPFSHTSCSGVPMKLLKCKSFSKSYTFSITLFLFFFFGLTWKQTFCFFHAKSAKPCSNAGVSRLKKLRQNI